MNHKDVMDKISFQLSAAIDKSAATVIPIIKAQETSTPAAKEEQDILNQIGLAINREGGMNI